MQPILDEFGFEDHVTKDDFKYIDKLLALAELLSGEWPPFCFDRIMFIDSRVDIRVSVNKSNPNCLILLSNRTKSKPNLSVSTGTELNPT